MKNQLTCGGGERFAIRTRSFHSLLKPLGFSVSALGNSRFPSPFPFESLQYHAAMTPKTGVIAAYAEGERFELSKSLHP